MITGEDAVEIAGLPRIVDSGQGGLLDILVPRDFARSSEILFSYSKRVSGGAGTALAIATLDVEGARLRDVRVLFEMDRGTRRGQHFGSRIVEAPDGHLFLTIGDRGISERAQDLGYHNGKVIRIARDGSVPADNPFVATDGALPEIWSYGHRNPQGATLDLDGQLWTSAHGAKGGDEINRIAAGNNYGWPVISYGENYNGSKIGVGTAAEGMEQPVFYWDPSIAPSGHMVYSGALFPDWRGDHFIGSLKFGLIAKVDPDGWTETRFEWPETGRVRDIVEGPDGAIWYLDEVEGAAFRVTPAGD